MKGNHIAHRRPLDPSWAIMKDIDTATEMSPGPEAKPREGPGGGRGEIAFRPCSSFQPGAEGGWCGCQREQSIGCQLIPVATSSPQDLSSLSCFILGRVLGEPRLLAL
jgi:hypothetical protein